MTTLTDNIVDIKDLFIDNDDIPDRKLSYIRKMFEKCLSLFVKKIQSNLYIVEVIIAFLILQPNFLEYAIIITNIIRYKDSHTA